MCPTWASLDSSPAIGADGTIYVGSEDGNLYAINPADGSQKWMSSTGNAIESSPAIGADGTIYVGSDDQNLYAFNPADGSQKWASPTGWSVTSSPALGADGTIYVGSWDNYLYAINPADGSQQWALATGNRIESSPALGADGTIYVGSDDGYLYAFVQDTPAQLQFGIQPGNTPVGAVITPPVLVLVEDAAGNRMPTASTPITLVLGANPGGANLGGTLTVNAVNGVATFSDLTLNQVGTGYTLMATAPGLTGTTSQAFTVIPPQITAVTLAPPRLLRCSSARL